MSLSQDRAGFRTFTIEAEGRWDASARTLALKETYTFDDGHSDILTWTIINRGDGVCTKGAKRSLRDWPMASAKCGFDDWFFLPVCALR